MDHGETAIGEGEQNVIVVLATSNCRRRESPERMRRIDLALKLGEQAAAFILAVNRMPRDEPLTNHMPNSIRVTGFEPAAFWTQTRRSTKLSYTLYEQRIEGLGVRG